MLETVTQFITNNIHYITLCIASILLLYLTKQVFEKHKKKEGFGIEDIGKIFELIPMIFTMIGDLALQLFDFINLFICPFRILAHLPLCMYYWFQDLFMYALWGIVFILVFIFVWLPVFICCLVICALLKNFLGFCWIPKVFDICPTKKGLANAIENVYRLFTGGRFIWRNRSDINNCYCLSPIQMAFDPFTKFRSYFGGVGSSPSDNKVLFSMAITILAVLFVGNATLMLLKSAKDKLMGSATTISALSSGLPPAPTMDESLESQMPQMPTMSDNV